MSNTYPAEMAKYVAKTVAYIKVACIVGGCCEWALQVGNSQLRITIIHATKKPSRKATMHHDQNTTNDERVYIQ